MAKVTCVRRALTKDSTLHAHVKDGLAAVKKIDVKRIHADVRNLFDDSIDLDEATRPGHENENRWDYLLGHSPTGKIVALEPHSAKDDQVSVVIRKRQFSMQRLEPQLATGRRVDRWLWVASGDVQLLPLDKRTLHLLQNGIQFVGKMVLKKHLPT